jgi:cation diffusion facilitator CzcD-associated flavoprotein CzcO
MHSKSKDQRESRNFVVSKMQEELQGHPDAQLQDHLIPNFALGCRRMTPGQGYLKSLAQPNVEVVKKGITRLTHDSVVDESGVEHKVDAVICATGFGHLFFPHFECIGRHGVNIETQFGDHPKAYLSVMTNNFPNLFCKFAGLT